MHPSLLVVGIVPAAVLTGLMLWAIVSMTYSIVNKRRVTLVQVLMVVLWLLALEAGISIITTVNAGLSHSEAAKGRLPLQYGVSAFIVVAIPTVGLLVLRSGLNKRYEKQQKA